MPLHTSIRAAIFLLLTRCAAWSPASFWMAEHWLRSWLVVAAGSQVWLQCCHPQLLTPPPGCVVSSDSMLWAPRLTACWQLFLCVPVLYQQQLATTGCAEKMRNLKVFAHLWPWTSVYSQSSYLLGHSCPQQRHRAGCRSKTNILDCMHIVSRKAHTPIYITDIKTHKLLP